MFDATSPISEAPTPARAAALWWAERIGFPVFRMSNGRDPAERRQTDIAEIAALMHSSQHPVDDAQQAKFVELLEARVAKLLKDWSWLSLSVDYGPEDDLADTAQAAGVNFSRFPWKTRMAITPDYVTASIGSGARTVLVWQAPDWVRPACHSERYANGEFFDELCSLPIYHDSDHGDWVADPRRCEHCGNTYSVHLNGKRLPHRWSAAAAILTPTEV